MTSRTLLNPNNTPREMWTYRQFVCWRYGEPKPGKKAPKEPINPRTLGHAGATWANTWADIYKAVKTYQEHDHLAGIGFALTKADPYVGIDLDNCIIGGELSPFACELLDELGTYAEVSPSGNGIRMIARCERLPVVVKQKEIEIYPDNHWLSLTGNVLNSHPVAEFEDLDWLVERFKPAHEVRPGHICAHAFFSPPQDRLSAEEMATIASIVARAGVAASDHTIWQRIRKGKLSDSLYRGDISEAKDDSSNAVVLLLKQLALHTLGDAARMEKMLRQTKLDQSRWDDKRGAQTWLQGRIDRVILRNAQAIEIRRLAREAK